MDISECKMGSIIYTYQRSKRKPIPLTEERIQTLKDHEKFLKRYRVGESQGIHTEPMKVEKKQYREEVTIPTRTKGKVAGTKPAVNWRLEESRNFTVAPAYNKGAYQVITKSNVKDIGR